jgi:hypothetical protein
VSSDRLARELASFEGLWPGGYYEGDPLEPVGRSSYGELGYMSVLHATYLRCIKPYIDATSVVLEVGPGRGAWTKTLLPAREVWVIDAVSAEDNRFWDHVGDHRHVRYLQVADFTCADLPVDHFTYMFSFGCYCHVSFEGITEHARNLFAKLRTGADCFWMVADYEKLHRVVGDLERYSIYRAAPPIAPRSALARRAFAWSTKTDRPVWTPSDDGEQAPGRWHDAGIDRTCTMLEAHGYEVVDPDVGTSLRDAIVHFRKP